MMLLSTLLLASILATATAEQALFGTFYGNVAPGDECSDATLNKLFFVPFNGKISCGRKYKLGEKDYIKLNENTKTVEHYTSQLGLLGPARKVPNSCSYDINTGFTTMIGCFRFHSDSGIKLRHYTDDRCRLKVHNSDYYYVNVEPKAKAVYERTQLFIPLMTSLSASIEGREGADYSSMTGYNGCYRISTGNSPTPMYAQLTGVPEKESQKLGCGPDTYYDEVQGYCVTCKIGTYSVGNQKVLLKDDCIPCPPGTYSEKRGGVSVTSCSLCPAGTYRAYVGATTRYSCIKCQAHTYSSVVGASSSSVCLPCPNYNAAASSGSTSLSDCSTSYCAPGAYYNVSTYQCTPCKVGSYSSSTRPTENAATCDLCPEHMKFTEKEGSISSDSCIYEV